MADDATRRRRRRRGMVVVLVGTVVLVGLLFAFVYPTRTFLDQRDATQDARSRLALLERENAKLAAEAKRLQDPAEVEKLARGYGLVKPGEQAFVIVPAPTTTAPPTSAGTGAPTP